MIRPAQPAATVPFSWLPVTFHTADSTKRPPSRGRPGSTLKMPISKLAHMKMFVRVSSATPVKTSARSSSQAAAREDKVGGGSCQGNNHRAARGRNEALELGVPAPEIQHDLLRGPVEGLGAQGMGELVDQHGKGKEHRIGKGNEVRADPQREVLHE